MNKLYDYEKLIILIFVGFVFFFVFMPFIDRQNNKEQIENFNNLISDDMLVKIDKNICSKQCCKHTQWPIPFNTQDPSIDNNLFKNFIGTNLSCNNGPSGGGCVCVTKDDYNYLINHGQ